MVSQPRRPVQARPCNPRRNPLASRPLSRPCNQRVNQQRSRLASRPLSQPCNQRVNQQRSLVGNLLWNPQVNRRGSLLASRHRSPLTRLANRQGSLPHSLVRSLVVSPLRSPQYSRADSPVVNPVDGQRHNPQCSRVDNPLRSRLVLPLPSLVVNRVDSLRHNPLVDPQANLVRSQVDNRRRNRAHNLADSQRLSLQRRRRAILPRVFLLVFLLRGQLVRPSLHHRERPILLLHDLRRCLAQTRVTTRRAVSGTSIRLLMMDM